jgi:hypothetical protein
MLVVPNKDGTYPEEKPGEEDPAPTAGNEEEPGQEAGGELEPEPDPEPNREEELQAQLAEERESRIRLEERLKVRDEQPPAPKEEPKVFTRQELQTAVDEGQIDADQKEEIWSNQQFERNQRGTEELLNARDKKRDTEGFVETETSRYLSAHPDVRKVDSPDWQKVKDEYDFKVRTGSPDSKETELQAMRAAFGANPERIPERTAARRETPGDASGSTGGGRGDRPVDIWNRVPDWCKSYYKKQVADGFKTLEDVKADIPYMEKRPH